MVFVVIVVSILVTHSWYYYYYYYDRRYPIIFSLVGTKVWCTLQSCSTLTDDDAHNHQGTGCGYDDDEDGRGLEYACEGDCDIFENSVSIAELVEHSKTALNDYE